MAINLGVAMFKSSHLGLDPGHTPEKSLTHKTQKVAFLRIQYNFEYNTIEKQFHIH